MLIFSYFTSCISHLSLVIIFNKVSVSVHLEATAGKSSTKLLLYFSTKPIKIYLWKCSIFVKVAGCRLASLLNLNFCTDIFQKFGPCNQFNTLQNNFFEDYLFSEAVPWSCSVKKMFLKFFQDSQKSKCVGVSF